MSRRTPHSPLSAILLASLLIAPAALHAQEEEQGAAPPGANAEPGTLDILNPETGLGNVAQMAMASFHAGNRALDRAEKLEVKAAEAEPSKREKALAKVEGAYEDAANSFIDAIRTNPKLLEAYTRLGSTYRAMGKHAEAVQVYNAALKLAPEDVENIYGRGEAFLALNYLREAATTYTELAGTHDQHAARLMASLKKWVADHRADPGEILPEAVETLGAWIEQQESGSG